MNKKYLLAPLAMLLLASGCTTLPSGPSVMVLPGTGKTFDQFRADEYSCRQYASDQIGGNSANQAAVDNTVRSAAVGTVIGALAGAAMGGHDGAGAGAGTGLLVGTMAGAGTGERSAYGTQRRYDNAYIQCMYAYGHRVPVAGHLMSGSGDVPSRPAGNSTPPPPPPPNYPPPGYPPPPPN